MFNENNYLKEFYDDLLIKSICPVCLNTMEFKNGYYSCPYCCNGTDEIKMDEI